MYESHHNKRRSSLLPLVAAAALAATTTSAPADVPWHLDCLDQEGLPLDGMYNPPGSGAGVSVYIVSTGIDPEHLEFEDRAYTGPEMDFATTPNDGLDCNGLGTWLACIVGGKDYGVAKDASLFGVRAFDCAGNGDTSGFVTALDYVSAQPGHRVVIVDFPAGVSLALDSAVEDLVNAGCIVVIAAGDLNDDACLYSPARVSNGITVGALDSCFLRTATSNNGSCVDLYAPGEAIMAAGLDGGFYTGDGTAASAAIVAGLAAIQWGMNPSLSPAEVWSEIQNQDCPMLGLVCGPAPERLPTDTNCDGFLNVLDLIEVIINWGECAPPCPADVDQSGVVDVSDLVQVIVAWPGE